MHSSALVAGMFFCVAMSMMPTSSCSGIMHHSHNEFSMETEFNKQLLKIGELRNRRLQDPTQNSALPPALNIHLLKEKRQETLSTDIAQLLDGSRSKLSAMHRLQEKMESENKADE